MSFTATLIILGLLIAASTIDGGPLNLQKLTSVTHILQPALYLIYRVDVADFSQYLDPRLTVATFNGKAHIVIYFTYESAYYAGLPSSASTSAPFQGVDVYTIVHYNNTLRRLALTTSLKNAVTAAICEPFAYEPYGCYLMKSESTVSLNNQTASYHFYSKTYVPRTNMFAEVNFTAQFQKRSTIDSNNLATLGGFYLSPQNNVNAVQSLYQKGNAATSLTPLATAMLNGLFHTQVANCTTQSLKSNFLRASIGPILGLSDEQTPAACFYAPYAVFNVTAAFPIITAEAVKKQGKHV